VRLVTYRTETTFGPHLRLGALDSRGEVVFDLQIAYQAALTSQQLNPDEANRLALSTLPSEMERFIGAGRSALSAARQALEFAEASDPGELLGPGGMPASIPLTETSLAPPLGRPNSLRDFIAFEDHALAGARRRGQDLSQAWYERPIYYKGNHRSIIGPEAELPRPSFTDELDFEMEIACVLGSGGVDLSEDEASATIFGFTIMNDWSARDVQRREMAAGLGPSKSKDFATSLGPCILVADEGSAHPSLKMVARVNGETICEADLGDAYWTFPQMVSFVSQGERVWPTDVYGSGTPYRGCLLDHGGPYLEPGDVVELEVEGIGLLRNRIV
jgi:2-keto-4-pentenoate hydratase/2-oxohepta-3-ene-1,7-dioic acid hydratase in catechol pathway